MTLARFPRRRDSHSRVTGAMMPIFNFDPRDFIVPPFSMCPHCTKEALGVLSIGDPAHLPGMD